MQEYFGAFLVAVLLDDGVNCLWLTKFAVCLTGGILGWLEVGEFCFFAEEKSSTTQPHI